MLQIGITIPKLATSRLSGFPPRIKYGVTFFRGNDWKCQQNLKRVREKHAMNTLVFRQIIRDPRYVDVPR